MNKFLKIFSLTYNRLLVIVSIIFLVSFPLSFFTTKASAAVINGFDLKGGDILITSNTSSSGFTGHAGIVTSSGGSVISIHPSVNGGKTHAVTVTNWINDNPRTKVIRHNNFNLALTAEKYAQDEHFNGKYKNQTYKFTLGVRDTTYLYCSEIVWQAYDFGALSPYKTGGLIKSIPQTILPYDYLSTQNLEYNNLTLVKTYAW